MCQGQRIPKGFLHTLRGEGEGGGELWIGIVGGDKQGWGAVSGCKVNKKIMKKFTDIFF